MTSATVASQSQWGRGHASGACDLLTPLLNHQSQICFEINILGGEKKSPKGERCRLDIVRGQSPNRAAIPVDKKTDYVSQWVFFSNGLFTRLINKCLDCP